FFFSSRRRHTRFSRDWSSDVCSSDLILTRSSARAIVLEEMTTGEALLIIGQRHLIEPGAPPRRKQLPFIARDEIRVQDRLNTVQIGRASCREREERSSVGESAKKNRT